MHNAGRAALAVCALPSHTPWYCTPCRGLDPWWHCASLNLPPFLLLPVALLQVRDWYVESFRELRGFPKVKDASDELQFTRLLQHIYRRHANVVPVMAMGVAGALAGCGACCMHCVLPMLLCGCTCPAHPCSWAVARCGLAAASRLAHLAPAVCLQS